MPHGDLITHLPIQLRADPSRVAIRPFVPADDPVEASQPRPRAQRIVDRILTLDGATLKAELDHVSANLADHHREVEIVLRRRFHEINGLLIEHCSAEEQQALLIGAYFSEEYALEAAALFNPSIVAHPDQTELAAGELRFILSLRAVGEGHISSVTFRTGVCKLDGAVTVDSPGAYAVAPRIENIPGGVPDEPGVRLFCKESHNLSETVIFPMTPSQRHGIEDVRLVRFTDDDGNVTYYGTYTAFSGQTIRQELLRTIDFNTFELNALRGEAANGKGMALFPRRIDGRYAMLGRQDHENIWLLTSSDLYDWQDAGQIVVTPRWPWEFIQIGNGGSPIEIEEGWLVITHGVGAVRNYCLGVCLLDRDDPTKLLGRMTQPLFRPNAEQRYGYVPNVAYTCGAMVHGRTLILPYAVADSYTTFATIPIDQLLLAMA